MLWLLLVALVLGIVTYDLLQKRHAILRNFPLVGHFRYLLESAGPELRHYFVTNNNEERPFRRDQPTRVFASAEQQNNYGGFGTDEDLELSFNYPVIKHETMGRKHAGAEVDADPLHPLPAAKILGGHGGRARAFRPPSVVNLSGMTFRSLSGAAVEASNGGSKIAGCRHNTREGGISPITSTVGS